MKVSCISTNEISGGSRLDSSFYLSDGKLAMHLVDECLKKGMAAYSLADKDLVDIWQPNRNTLLIATETEKSVKYLQPYDILEYLPEARFEISINSKNLDSLKIHSGTILQTCSGRNLGPLVIADPYLEQFVFGSDLIRIDISDIKARYYIFAFLNTWIGQALLHSNKTGSVIDHLSAKDIECISIPIFDSEIVDSVVEKTKKAHELFSQARSELYNYRTQYYNKVGVILPNNKLCTGWQISLGTLMTKRRIDAAYYDPTVENVANQLKSNGGVLLKTVAKVEKPSGRSKTNYVDKEHGVPYLSGRQLLQNQTVGLKYIPRNQMGSFENHVLRKGTIAYPADGRVEGRLGTPMMITKSRAGWCASGHVGRIEALEGINPGYLYLALSHPAVRAQISALACGSVVDAVYPEDVEQIIIPPQDDFPYDKVMEAWNKFDDAQKFQQEACNLLIEQFENHNTHLK